MEKEMKYEEAIKELEEITKKLEAGELQIEDALSSFSRAVDIIKTCRAKLDGAKEEVSILVNDGNGNKNEIPF